MRDFVQTIDALDRRASSRLMVRSPRAGRANWLLLLGAHLGDSWLWALLLAWSFYLARPQPTAKGERPARRKHLFACLVGLVLQIGLTLSVKQLVRRPRPTTGHLLYGAGPDQHSFP
ncbi:MAG TPA: hypothetical protein PKE45_14350, partial [Caldilineaceae bacterium]|nr:hypothetical protein [Caldilineaceae bacterium]